MLAIRLISLLPLQYFLHLSVTRLQNAFSMILPRVFHDPLVSLNFEGFDPQIFLNDPQNSLFTFFNSYEGSHCDPLNRKMRENPDSTQKFGKGFFTREFYALKRRKYLLNL